jgi:murein DD-endopeptidase MepM/ murein hydrolase activator NlpD
MGVSIRQIAAGNAARLLGGLALLLALAGCTTEKPWWEGGRSASPDEENIEATPMAPPGRGGTYIVQPGDTLYKISRRENIPIRSLIDANDLQPPYAVRSGQRLVLPNARYHVVQKGDTVYSISRTYGVDMATLTSTNHIPAPYKIRVGERLQLPSRVNRQVASADDEAPTPAARPGSGSGSVSVRPVPAPTTTTPAQPKEPLPEPPTATGQFIWPAQGKIISSFGAKENGLHNDGINIAVPAGTPVKAAQSGVVAYAGNELKGYGNLLLIRHANGWMTAYAHNSKLLVKRGDKVTKGETISLSGSTGSVTSPQVHFEVRKGAKAVDPQSVISG